jgi:hypothetical protein
VIDADDDRLAALERRGRLVALVTVEVVVGLAIAAVVMVLLHTSSALEVSGSASVVRRYGVAAGLVLVGLFVVMARRGGVQRALLTTGGLAMVAALVVGVTPPGKPGPVADCHSVLGDFWGRHGDEDEGCYDLRRVQTVDVASTAGVGLVLLGGGTALSARPQRREPSA